MVGSHNSLEGTDCFKNLLILFEAKSTLRAAFEVCTYRLRPRMFLGVKKISHKPSRIMTIHVPLTFRRGKDDATSRDRSETVT